MSRDDAILSAFGRLVEALADDLLGAPDAEVLASHRPAEARGVADAIRRRLHRDAPDASTEVGPVEPPRGRPRELPHRPERKP